MLNKDFILRYKYSLAFGGIGLVLLLLAMIVSMQAAFFNRSGKESDFTVENSANSENELLSKFLVDIEGAVLNPGVYEINEGERIDDLLKKAGGFLENADLDFIAKTVNKAQTLSDGAKIYIPFKKENSGGVAGASLDRANGLININSDSSSKLESLSGIGEKTAQKIIDGRPYGDISELVSKKIVSNSVFEKIKDQISVY